MAFSVMAIGSLLFIFTVPDNYDVNVDFITADGLYVFCAVVGIPCLLLSIIMFCIFTFRAMKNLHACHAPSAEMKPGWAVGWYFIPIANLFMPYRGMDQIWHGTREMVPQLPDLSRRLPIWWGGWVAGGLLDRVALRMDGGLFGAASLEMQKISAGVTIVSSVLLVTAALAILPILRSIAHGHAQLSVGHAFS